jgi:hypothetical protein
MIPWLQIGWAVIGAVFGAGGAWTAMQLGLAKEREDREREDKSAAEDREREDAAIRKDLNGIAANLRQEKDTAERRWKHMIATAIETSRNLQEAKLHAKLLREDAWGAKKP